MDWSDYEVDGQLSIFDLTMEEFKITKPIRLIELFAGVGSQAMALRELGADFEHYRVVEFDKYAIASYNAIHVTDFPAMDITQISGSDLGIVDTDKYCYIMTYSFPCQDLSFPESKTRRGRVQEKGQVSPTLMAGEQDICRIENQYRIRKLTPLSCWRLMDFTDEDFEKAAQVNSNTQLYKQAGNSIVKNVLVAILGQMIPGKENVYKERNNET